MGKIAKPMLPRHRETMSPFVKDFVQAGVNLKPFELPQHLATFPTRWPFPRGDLFHWIPLLNHFDQILETFCKTYKLSEGPQTEDFGNWLTKLDKNLEEISQHTEQEVEFIKANVADDADRDIVESILNFSRMLLENCGNRSLYSSSTHLNDLLNTTSLTLLDCTLQLAGQLAQRYQASLKRVSLPNKSASTQLLANHYNLDLDRVLQLSLPFAKNTLSSDTLQSSSTATPSAKGKEKASFSVQPTAPNTTSHANDLVSLVKSQVPTSSPSPKNGSTASVSEEDWEVWGNVRVTYYSKPTPKVGEPAHTHPLQSSTSIPSAAPSTPTPVRRTSNLSPHGGQRANRTSSSDESPLRSPANNPTEEIQSSTLKIVEIPSSKLTSSPLHQLLQENLESVPKETQYELLTKMRVARALTSSLETRRQILAIRLLAVTNLAYIHSDPVFQEKVLKQDLDEPRRLQLIYQLAELIHPPAEGHVGVPRSLQTVALNALVALSQHGQRFFDVCNALNTSVNHGVLLYIVRKAVAEMNVNDNSGLKVTDQDEWRKALLALLSQVCGVARNAAELVSAGLIPILVEVLTLRTNVAKRHHHMIIQFLDTVVYSVRDAFQALVNADGLDTIANLIVDEVNDAIKLRTNEDSNSGSTLQTSYRSSTTDYKIPYFQQQTMKWLLKFIHHMMSSAGGYGGNFDRLLRNLIDSPKLLESLRVIISSSTWFGSIVWTNAVSILNDFINNEPTSFAVIAEAGLGKAFLEEVSGEPVVMPPNPPDQENSADRDSNDSPVSSDDEDENGIERAERANEVPAVAAVAPQAEPETPNLVAQVTTTVSHENRSSQLASGILPSADTINIIPHAFGALCLNENGMRMFQASSALRRFFEIFLSPKHIAVMNSDPEIPASLGGCFDELVRHHPPLRPAIIDAILEMVRGVNELCKTKATKDQVGAKLWAIDSRGHSVIADDFLNDLATEDSMDIELTDQSQKSQPVRESTTPYVTATSSFLAAIIGNQSVKSAFIEKGGIEDLLELSQNPSAAYNFGATGACDSLKQVIEKLAEQKPHIVMPSLLQRLQSALDVLTPFLEHDGQTGYFHDFALIDGPRAAKNLSNGTALVKALTNVHALTQFLGNCVGGSMFSHSRSSTGHNQLNLADLYIKLVKSLGALLGASGRERILLSKGRPDSWNNFASSHHSHDTIFGGESSLSESSFVTPSILSEEDPIASGIAVADGASTLEAPLEQPNGIRSAKAPTKKESDLPGFKNYQTLSYLLNTLQQPLSRTLQVLGKSVISKRHDGFQRQSQALIADALANTILQQLTCRKFNSEEDSYSYLIPFLGYMKESLVAEDRAHDKPLQSITLVLKAFKTYGGFDAINALLEKFEKCLSESEPRPGSEPHPPNSLADSAERGIQKILELYEILSNGKVVCEAMQTTVLVGQRFPDSDFFSSAQFVVELRMAMLPSVRRLWESNPIIEKGSTKISNYLINIIRTIAVADFEQGAYKQADPIPPHNKTPAKKFRQNAEQAQRFKEAGYSEDLIIEALFRCNNNSATALEYCEFHKKGLAGQRNPPPPEAQQSIEASRPASEDDGTPMALDTPADGLPNLADDWPELSNPFQQQAVPAVEATAVEAAAEQAPATTSSDQPAQPSENEDKSKRVFVDDLNSARAKIRRTLIDRSLDVINAHGEVTFEISELIATIIVKSIDPSPTAMRRDMGATLVYALVSFAGQDIRPIGKKVAANAHLLALMLQDKDFYNAALGTLKEQLSELISFVKVSPDHTSGEPSPWIANILLIVEILLCDDAQPKETKWTAPTAESSSDDVPPLELTEPSVSDEEKAELFTAILEILPRVGTDSSLALAILRILVILTRTRSIAQSLGEKKNIQRLFVLAKGLSGSISERLQSPLLIILRHIIEDDETVKQIMRADIKTYFSAPRSHSRNQDLQSYIKHHSHIIIRSPKMFVDVTNEMVKLMKWGASSADAPLRQFVCLKETPQASPKVPKSPEDPVLPTVQATEDLTLGDVKTSTELAENGTAEKFKTQPEHKAPIVENPDGVIYFLITELLNYREINDVQPPVLNTEKPTTSESDMPDATAAQPDVAVPDVKDSKKKQEFKPEEHPIYIYRCLLLQCLTELLSSYNRTKIEFINFKRNSPLSVMTPSKPRSTVLNYLLFDLIPVGSLEHPETIALRKKQVTSMWADSALCALLSKTGEQIVDRSRDPSDGEDEPDLLFVRRFVIENILKAYKEASTNTESLELKYSRMLSLADLMQHIMAGKESQSNAPDHTSHAVMMRSQMQLKRIMYEKGYISALTASVADIDLNFPGAKRAVKYILKPLKLLTQTAIELSESATVALPGQADDEISSASSVSDADEREETPDLFRNSALGMFEGAGEEESSSESGDDDGDIYGEDYEDEEMDYEEDIEEDDEDNISEEDPDIEAMGGIEGLSGEIGIEIEMSDDDDEDEDDEDPSDEDEDMDHDMDGEDARIEIIEDDGNGEGEDEDDWESHEEDEEDYEAQAEAAEEEAQEEMERVRTNHLVPSMIRALAEDPEMIQQLEEEGLDAHDLYMDDVEEDEDEEDEDEEDMDDEMYGDYAGGQIHRSIPFGWDSDAGESPAILQRAGRTRHGIPPPFPFGNRFLPGGPHGDPLGVPDYIGGGRYRSHRPGPTARNADDGINPLLQRSHPFLTGAGNRHAVRGPNDIQDILDLISRGPPGLDPSFDLGRGLGVGESPVAFLHGLLNAGSGPGPVISRHGHALHLQYSGNSIGMPRELQAMFGIPRGSRLVDSTRRDVPPNEAVQFSPQSTSTRWSDEAKLLFGATHPEKAMKILNSLLNILVPPAWEAEKIAVAAEKERTRKLQEEAKKRAEEERIAKEAKEAKEAEEKAEREKKEAEERERKAAEEAEAEAANAMNEDTQAALTEENEVESGEAMEGVESTSAPVADAPAEVPAADRPRVTTMIRGSPYDITDLGIDPEFLNELPEEIKEEVIMSAVADRRSQAAATGAQPSEIDREFLEALPSDIRDEIVQQERLERRRREREEARRSAAASGGPGLIPQDMDAASIFATMSPALRQQVLMEQDEETIAQLPAELAAQARALNRQHRPPAQRDSLAAAAIAARREELRDAAPGDISRRPQRRTIAEMLDKSGVATLLRLMFVLQQGSLRSILCNVLENVCENRSNRAEVVTTLLLILQDGSADMSAVERGFAQLSLRAKSQQLKEGKESKDPKTPTSALVKRSSTGPGSASIAHGSTEISPLIVIQQCLNTLAYLSSRNPHIASFFLTEHESTGGLKRSLSRKGRGKDSKAAKYALNSLLSLLDRNLIMESSSVMESLSDLLGKITNPLQGLERKQKEASEEVKKAEEAVVAAEAPPTSTTEPSESVASPETTTSSDMQLEQPTEASMPDLIDIDNATENASAEVPTGGDGSAAPADEKEKKIAAAKEAREAAYKKLRTFSTPVIPEHNLKLVINIFVARECSSKTFRETLSTIKNLSAIPGAKEAFGKELIRKAQGLGEIILVDLGELLPQIQKASTGTEIQGVALAKFSPGGSDQNKLLRVLTALDHLFDPKIQPKKDESAEAAAKDQATEKQDLLATLYENSTFGPMWDKLSACLAAIRQREHMLSVATILLPLIESLMVVCKNTTLKDAAIPQAAQEMTLNSPAPENRMESLFFTFTEEHRKILNDLVRHTPKLMIGTFSLLVKNPKVLEFDNKRNYFNRSIHNRSQQTRVSFPPLQLSVRRDNVFHDSYKSLAYKSPDEMKYGKLSIRFHGEEGVDAGGVTREWFQVLSRQMFDPDYALFVPVSSDRTTFHPNLLSSINQEHLSFFKFIGRVIGKALFEGRVLDCHFSRAVYKRILGKSVSVKDMESLDPDYYKSIIWMLSNNITDIITETFSVENDKFGLVETVDLIENGRNVAVTEENKGEYIKLVVEHKLQNSVKEQLDHFLTGFHEIIPAELVAIFNENELELLISGLPEIDVDDWKSNTEYHNYSAASPQIQWFWRAVRSYDKEERAKLLQFVTGTSKVPLNGFKELEGMNGFSRFNIHRDYGSKERLPSSHTCFNQLDLPEYENYDSLRQHLLMAITTGSEYFGFA